MALFYEENQIKAMLKCAICEDQIVDPITLPFNRNVCKQCVFGNPTADSNNNPPQYIRCRLCAKSHRVPAGGFVVNPILVDLLNQQPVEVQRSESYKALRNNLAQISPICRAWNSA